MTQKTYKISMSFKNRNGSGHNASINSQTTTQRVHA
jgi:hypothetical protein